MDPVKPRWRFFTRLIEDDGAAAHLWCWVRLNAEDRVVDSGSGFYTVIGAMADARAHGFNGRLDAGDPDYVLEQFGDRRSFAI